MSEAFLERLYTPFEQETGAAVSKFRGTGLGMPITKNLVTLLGGTISVKSRLNEGTTFTVELPFDLAAPREEGAKYPAMDALKVLVGDNEQDACRYMSLLLQQFGISATCVLSGRGAVEEIRRAHEAEEEYDVCLIDWKMPDLDGLETAREIRSIVGAETLIIILTAYDYSEIEQAGREAGVNFFLSKPLFASTLYNTLLDATGRGKQPIGVDAAAKDFDFSGRRVLLAEDNDLNLEIAAELLRLTGAEVVAAEDGKQALEQFAASEAGTFDVILMDIQMPEMDGYASARAIRDSAHPQARSIPIIAMTANAFEEDVTAALDSGMDAHVSKPIDTNVLYKTLQKFLSNGR